MANNNRTDTNLFKFHINQEYIAANINVKDADYKEIKMETKVADNNGTDTNLFKFYVNQEYTVANTNVEDADYKEIKIKTEVVGGSWVHERMEERLQNENGNRNLEVEDAVEQLVNKNSDQVCETCKMDYKHYCMNCGHLIHILDNEMNVGIFSRAMQSIPKDIFEIKGSLMEGYGVYAQRNIPQGVKLGPYEGVETVKRGHEYFWKIKYAKLIEANGENYCNWMRFINYTTADSEKNLIALQFMGKLYYKTLREIKIGKELLISYGDSGYDHSKLCSIQYFQPEIEIVNGNIFKCAPCCFGFSEERYLVNHNRVCPYKIKTALEVDSKAGIKEFEDHPKVCERVNNVSSNCQKDNENGKLYKDPGLDDEEMILERDHIKHMKVYIKEEKVDLKCPYVYNDYLTTCPPKEQVLEHQKKNCEENIILNDANGDASVRKDTLVNSHIESSHTVDKPHKCNECSYTTVRKDTLQTHVKHRHTMEKSYKCNNCSYAAVQKVTLLSHIKSCHTIEKPYKCNECSFSSARKDTLLIHIKCRHTMEKPYKCNDCSYATALKGSLIVHIKSYHSMEKPYKCKECSYAAVQKGCLLGHIKSHHTIEKTYKKLKCNECSYTSERKDSLINHIKSYHTMEKSYKCNDCSYTTVRKHDLLSHVKHRHTIEKPYKCNACSYTAAQKNTLLCHVKSRHTMEKSYKCNECPYASVRKSQLLSHIKHWHTKDRPNKCNECSYASVTKANLLAHIKSWHTMEKP